MPEWEIPHFALSPGLLHDDTHVCVCSADISSVDAAAAVLCVCCWRSLPQISVWERERGRETHM